LGRPVDDVLDLSASLNPFAPDVAAEVARAASLVHHYPDPSAAANALADAIGVDPDRLVLTNGGSEAIALVAGLLGAGWVERPEFALYERHLARVSPDAGRWRSNPSNPMGRLAPPGSVARVWDEAFYPLATGRWTRGDDDAWRLGSLTKLWACPGLRIGYVVAPSAALAQAVRDRQPRWSVNGLASAVVEALLPATDLGGWVGGIAVLRRRLLAGLRERGLVVHDTDACWLLVERSDLRRLLAPHGVLVRDCTSFGLPHLTRLAVPGDQARDRLFAALDRVL
jgi:threonine-phosphate decarboxylase